MKFLSRYWHLALAVAIFLALALNNTIFAWAGQLVYLPLLCIGVFFLATVLRRWQNKDTTDEYIRHDQYNIDFKSLDPLQKIWLTNIQWWIYLIVVAIIAASVMAEPSVPDFRNQLRNAKVRPEWIPKLDKIAFEIKRDQVRYEKIQNMRANGMPWFTIGCIHERESSRNFARHLHEGGLLQYVTRNEPKGRIPKPAMPPFTFEQSAEDALYVIKTMDKVEWPNINAALDAIEKYNGIGYRKYHPDVPTPYLWSGTNYYTRGKYVADGRFSRIAVDQQPGVAALCLRAAARNL